MTPSQSLESPDAATAAVVVSCDSHVGPRLREDLREYCPKAYLEQYDAFVAEDLAQRDAMRELFEKTGGARGAAMFDHPNMQTAGHYDAPTRLREMDADGEVRERAREHDRAQRGDENRPLDASERLFHAREGEPDQVEETFGRHFRVPLVHVKAADRFLGRLGGVVDPELKRKAIGEEFIRVFEEVARDLADARFLVQGTLYPDVIESGSKTAANIKSHHNVGGLPEDMTFELVEPLRDLFKDEVRAVGVELGLPEEIVRRQPFPGPGLAVRIVGEVTVENLAKVRGADAVVREEIKRAGFDRSTWQAFCVLLADVQSVGVMGDGRTYENPVIVRAVTSEDAMTADWARLPDDVLDRISSRIVREVPGVNRVAYDITSKPPGTIEWE